MRPVKPVLILSALTILDWYDGVVRAIGVDHKKQQQYLIILAAWDINTARRAYVLVELPTDIANEMTGLLEANSNDMAVKQKAWNSFNNIYDKYLCNYKGNLHLTLDKPNAGQQIASIIVDSTNLQRLTDYDIEKTLTETACTFWFNLT